jgi:3-methyladenine DNA glycosylase AlkC
MKEKFSLKDALFNPTKVTLLATQIQQVFPSFQKEQFINTVISKFPELELKQRITHISECLYIHLPSPYPEALAIILQALPPMLDPDREDDDFWDFIYAPYGEFVATYGCNDVYMSLSLQAIEQITKRFSMEYAIRSFAVTYPEQTYIQMQQRAQHENYHVRRLASEWSRPSLPRGKNIWWPIDMSLSILEYIYADPTMFVVRSVANHLNDLTKIHADRVIETLQRWKSLWRQESKRMEFLIRHALRTQIKAGYIPALALVGKQQPQLSSYICHIETPTVIVGTYLDFSFAATSLQDQDLHLTYTIYFTSSTGRPRSKIFVLCDKHFSSGQHIYIRKKHLMKDFSTRKLYAGLHRVEVSCGGVVLGEGEFEVR